MKNFFFYGPVWSQVHIAIGLNDTDVYILKQFLLATNNLSKPIYTNENISIIVYFNV